MSWKKKPEERTISSGHGSKCGQTEKSGHFLGCSPFLGSTVCAVGSAKNSAKSIASARKAAVWRAKNSVVIVCISLS